LYPVRRLQYEEFLRSHSCCRYTVWSQSVDCICAQTNSRFCLITGTLWRWLECMARGTTVQKKKIRPSAWFFHLISRRNWLLETAAWNQHLCPVRATWHYLSNYNNPQSTR